MPITIRERSLIVFKINAPRERKYMGYNPKGELRKVGSDPR